MGWTTTFSTTVRTIRTNRQWSVSPDQLHQGPGHEALVFLCTCVHAPLFSSHAATVGRRQPFNCLPRSLSIHEGHSLIPDGATAGLTTDFLTGDTPVLHQGLESQVIVFARAEAGADAVLKQDYLIRVVSQTEITHTHLPPLQVAVTAAPGLLALALPWTRIVSGALPPALSLLLLHRWPRFCKRKIKNTKQNICAY